jgi:replicative DNA helicase
MAASHQVEPAATLAPYDLAAECALLGAMLSNPSAVMVARDSIKVNDFYRYSHGTIFSAMLALAARGESVDIITVSAELRQQGVLAAVGGEDFIHTLPALCPVAVSVRQYAAIVNKLARRRAGITLARHLEHAFSEGTDEDQQTTVEKLLDLLGIAAPTCACHGDAGSGAGCRGAADAASAAEKSLSKGAAS